MIAATGFAACGGPTSATTGGGAHGSTTTKPGSALDAPMRVQFGTGSIGAPDPTTTLPNEGGRTIPPELTAGQNLIITPQGCIPQTLEANVDAPVVWTNLSGHPQRIVFKAFPVDSGTIPPGGTFSWSTRSAVALAYTLLPSGWVGKIDMNQVNP